MVSPVDLVSAPSSTNPYIHALTWTYAFKPGYQIRYVLQGNPGDTGSNGGALWAAKGAAQAFTLAAQAWAAVANISIAPASTSYDGTGSRAAYTWVEKLTGDLDDGVLGQHSLPGVGDMEGDFSNTISVFTTANNAVGGYSFLTFLHEIGHGLGLTHPHEEGNAFPGVDGDDDMGDNALNQAIYTVMSYNDGVEGNSPSDAYGWSATPMAFDIATIQNLYGANMSTAAGNNVYLLPQSNGAGTSWICIWDAGGIDTISAGATATGTTIDLRAATLLDEQGGGGWLSDVSGIQGGFTIAHNVVIENATGGTGDDTINGNEAANLLIGGGGHDHIWGYGGNDRIESGNGYSELRGGDGDDSLVAGSGGGELFGDAGNDVLQGGSGNTIQHGGIGNDWLIGGSGNDTLYGDDGTDLFIGGGGDDIFHVDSASELVFENAGEGTDTIVSTVSLYLPGSVENLTLDMQGSAIFGVGNELANQITGNNLDNLLLGGAGNDVVQGYGGNDLIYGEAGDDVIDGSFGVDYLVGGAGNDTIQGSYGADALYGEDGDDILDADGREDGGASVPPPPDFVTDILVGGAGNDILKGASGLGDYDLMDGGAGNDTYYVDTTADLTFEAADGGTDTVFARVIGNGYYLYANVENLVLLDNTAFGVGNELANHLTGSDATNWLLGGAGNDVINGKGGNDVLFGEAGADTFVFEHGTGGDTIGDFTAGTDKIDLSAFGFTSFAQVQAAMSENGGTTAIILGSDYVVLNGVANAALHAGDFILSGGSAAEQLVRPDAAGDAGDDAGRGHLIHDFMPPVLMVPVGEFYANLM